MTPNAFLDGAVQPTPALLAATLGAKGQYWSALTHHAPGPVVEVWKYYGRKLGWSLKLLAGKRNLCFLTVRAGYFTAGFVLGDKAVAAAQRSRLSPDLVRELVAARKYAEGRGIRIDVTSRRALEQAKLLLDIKLASQRTIRRASIHHAAAGAHGGRLA